MNRKQEIVPRTANWKGLFYSFHFLSSKSHNGKLECTNRALLPLLRQWLFPRFPHAKNESTFVSQKLFKIENETQTLFKRIKSFTPILFMKWKWNYVLKALSVLLQFLVIRNFFWTTKFCEFDILVCLNFVVSHRKLLSGHFTQSKYQYFWILFHTLGK